MEHHPIIVDPEYHYLRVDPIPTSEDVEKYYRDEFYTKKYPSFNDSSLDVQTEERISLRAGGKASTAGAWHILRRTDLYPCSISGLGMHKRFNSLIKKDGMSAVWNPILKVWNLPDRKT